MKYTWILKDINCTSLYKNINSRRYYDFLNISKYTHPTWIQIKKNSKVSGISTGKNLITKNFIILAT